MRVLVERWNQFFFAPVPLLPAALFRIFLSVTMLIMYSIRFVDWRFYFTDHGFVRGVDAADVLPEFFRPSFSWYPVSEGAVVGCQILFLVAIFLLMLGVGARLMALVAFVLHLAFMQRNFSIVYGADIVVTFLLFSLIFINSGRRLSVLSRSRTLGRVPSEIDEIVSTMGVRLLQIQMCIIYGYTGLEKLKGPSWWDGTAVWAVLGNQQIAMFDATWLRHAPILIMAMTFVTVLWEIYFPVLIWLKPFRRWVLLLGLLLHIGIAATVGLVFFSLVMVSTYFVFMDPWWLELRVSRVKGLLRRSH